MVSAVIRVFGWVVILGRKGLINQALWFLGFDGQARLLYTEGAVLIGLITIVLPFMVLPLMSAIERIPPSLEEADLWREQASFSACDRPVKPDGRHLRVCPGIYRIC